MENEGQKDYSKLIAAQNESNRRLRLKSVINTLEQEHRGRMATAICSGICFSGLIAAIHFSGVNIDQAIQTEIQALSSFTALKEYLATFTPAMWGTTIATIVSISRNIRHRRRYNDANREFYDIVDNEPENYQNIVEHQAKSR